MTVIQTNQAPKAIGPYVQGRIANGFLFASGQVPLDAVTGEVVGSTIEEQTAQVLKNISAILTEARITPNDIVKTTCFLKNMDDFAVMNDIYASYLEEGSFPARETVQVSCLPKNVDIEISMIAHEG